MKKVGYRRNTRPRFISLAIFFTTLLICILLIALQMSERQDIRSRAAGIPKGVSWGSPAQDWGTNWSAIDGDLQDMQNAGINWMRTELHYEDDLSYIDQIVQKATAHNINILFILYKNPPHDGIGTAADRATYKQWVTSVVNRYKQTVHSWEILNEENLGGDNWKIDITPGSDQTQYTNAVHDYVLLLQDAYTTIKAADPTAKVLLGGLSEWLAVPRFTDALISENASQYFDIFAYHPYGNNPQDVASKITELKAALAKQPDGIGKKPIWITEIGFNTSGWNPGSEPDEQTKATYLTQTMQNLRTAGVQLPIFWYDLHEGHSTTSGFGLLSKDPQSLKTTYFPAYTAYKNLWADEVINIPSTTLTPPQTAPTFGIVGDCDANGNCPPTQPAVSLPQTSVAPPSITEPAVSTAPSGTDLSPVPSEVMPSDTAEPPDDSGGGNPVTNFPPIKFLILFIKLLFKMLFGIFMFPFHH